MSQLCVRASVSGHVQGVGFRYHTAHEGLKRSLTGYARNEADGKVTVMMCGKEENVHALLEWLEQGPPTSRVVDVTYKQVEW